MKTFSFLVIIVSLTHGILGTGNGKLVTTSLIYELFFTQIS